MFRKKLCGCIVMLLWVLLIVMSAFVSTFSVLLGVILVYAVVLAFAYVVLVS